MVVIEQRAKNKNVGMVSQMRKWDVYHWIVFLGAIVIVMMILYIVFIIIMQQ